MPKILNKTSMPTAKDSLNYSRRRSKQTKTASILLLSEQGNHVKILKILADEHTSINDLRSRMENNDTALHVAASRGHTKAVSVLLGTVINVHDTGHRKRTPLHCSAINGHKLVTQRLLEAGAKVDAEDADGATALHLAEKNEHAEVVLLLARNGAKITDETIFMAVLSDNTGLVDLCLQKGKSIHTKKDGVSLVAMAAKEAKFEMVIFLLSRDADPTHCKNTNESPLLYASKAGHVEAVRLILERGVKSDSGQVKRALMVAKNRSVIHVFLDIVPKFIYSSDATFTLLWAANEGRLDTLDALCEAGINVNVRDGNGHTALSHAAGKGHTLCLKELIRRGADLNAKNEIGNTPLHLAAMRDHADCVRALVEAGANPMERNRSRKTPFNLAKSDVVLLLLLPPPKRVLIPNQQVKGK